MADISCGWKIKYTVGDSQVPLIECLGIPVFWWLGILWLRGHTEQRGNELIIPVPRAVTLYQTSSVLSYLRPLFILCSSRHSDTVW